MPRSAVEAAVRLDRSVLLISQFALDQAVAELARFDLERLHVPGHLFAGTVAKHCFENRRAWFVGAATNENYQVRLEGYGHRRRGRKREHDAGKVDAGRWSGNLAKVDVFDE